MNTLCEVCVWEMPFPPAGFDFVTTGSPNAFFKTDCAVGIGALQFDNISIYPNPTNTLLTIETELPGLHAIEITSLNGQMT